MTKAEKKSFLEDLLLKQDQDNYRLKLNIKYYKTVVLPHLKVERKEKRAGKAEVDRVKNQIPEWERSIDMNEKFMEIVKKELSYLEA